MSQKTSKSLPLLFFLGVIGLGAIAFQSGEYPLLRSLFVAIAQNGSLEQQAGESYANFLLTDEGQELLSRVGFVKIR
jgi:phosphate transport system substrate-binding protein